MADHSELVAEISVVEKMATNERLKHAKKRRQVQLKKFSQYEKQCEKDRRKKAQSTKDRDKVVKPTKKLKTNRVQFVSNIMLLESAARNAHNEVEQLLRDGVNTDVTNEDGLTALHQCCIDDLENLLLLLIKYGANVNAQDSELWTPLHAAATCGHVHLCKILIEHGAVLLAMNADGNMPYDICEDDITLDYIESEMAKRGVTQELIDETRLSTERKMLDGLILLADAGSSLEACGRSGETPLHIAAANGYIQVTEFLLKQQVSVDVTDDDTWQPIHAAACWGHLTILEMLVQHGAEIEARTKNGESPLEICEDAEVRQRIMEMRDEMKSHRATKSHDLRRRKSQNSRSASIRRTSMREKMPMALREAREEAQRLRESGTSDDEREEEGIERMEKMVVNGKQDDDKGLEQGSSHHSNDLKGTSIFMEEDCNPPSAVEFIDVEVPEDKPAPTNGHTPVETIPTVPSRHARGKGSEVSDSIPPPVAPPTSNNKAKPEPTSQKKSTNHKPVSSTPTPTPVTVTEASPPVVDDSLNVTNQDSEFSESRSLSSSRERLAAMTNLSQSQDSLYSPHSGTLADLKKQRAHKLQENMRNKDTVSLSSISDINQRSHSDSENNIVVVPSNGQNKNHNGIQHKNTYYIAGEPPKRKFTASNNEIIGGVDESKTNCCTIL